MLSKNQIKHLKSLSQSKFRQKYNNFVAEGEKSANEIIQSHRFEIEAVYALQQWVDENSSLVNKISNKLEVVDKKTMQQISLLSTANSVYLLLKKPKQEVNLSLISKEHMILLDGVQDPGNVGTIIRIADWFGIKRIIANPNTADFFHPKVVQASMGSICHVELIRASSDDVIEICKNHITYGLTLKGETMSSKSFITPGIIVMGNEGKGISSELLPLISKEIYIPGAVQKGAESLNVSVATGIIAYQIFNLHK